MAKSDLADRSESYPLAAYKGAPPPAPDWFQRAIETPYTTHSVEVEGARVEYQKWGRSGKPGLLLVHGGGAHAHWFDFIAPSFVKDYDVVAMTFTGMGNSDWRETYSPKQFSAEQLRVLEHSGLLEHDEKPIVAAHSFGGVITIKTASEFGDLLHGVVIMDTPVFEPNRANVPSAPKPRTADIFFPDQETALARFRLLPPQPCENHYILDYIARHSLKQVERNAGRAWAWKFDPTLWEKIGDIDVADWEILPQIGCNLAFMRGERSILVADDVREAMLTRVSVPFPSIQNAHHHLFLDNPLDTISELQTIFADWEKTRG